MATPRRDDGRMVAPVVTSLGHAGLRIDAPHLTMLCDPWMSSQGAFLGSWFPFPDNSHLRRPDVLDADWVAISHEHLDHLDLDLLRTPARAGPDRHPAVPRTGDVLTDPRGRHPQRRHPARSVGTARAQRPRRLGDGHPGAVADVPRRRHPRVGGRARDPAHERRAAHTVPAAPCRRGGGATPGPHGRADVRGVMAPDLLRVPAPGRGLGERRQAPRQVQVGDPAAAVGPAQGRHAVCRPAVLPRSRPRPAQRPDRTTGHLPRHGTGRGIPPRQAARARRREAPARRPHRRLVRLRRAGPALGRFRAPRRPAVRNPRRPPPGRPAGVPPRLCGPAGPRHRCGVRGIPRPAERQRPRPALRGALRAPRSPLGLLPRTGSR